MRHCRFVTTLFYLSFSCASAQQLYMPRDIRKTYENETRSPDGLPGKNYWQNSGRYEITVTANPPDNVVSGEETIHYVNNSPDTLRNPVIKLFLNIHKPGAPREIPATTDYLTSGMHVDAVTYNGATVNWNEIPGLFTWQPFHLPAPLTPGDSMTISFKWHYEISRKSNREGMIDSTTYFLAYFYPRIAVFDDYNGWDRMDFTDSHEFYSDFNDYKVTINVPANYIVWGTGTLLNAEKVLQPPYLLRFSQSLSSDETVHVVTPEDLVGKKITRQNAMNSWQFKAVNIPDMTFGLSDHYVWDASSVVVDDHTGRRASVQAAYSAIAEDFKLMVGFGRHALEWFSHHWPGIPYPYEKTTIFQGFAGMEYPMMANDESYQDPVFSRFVAEHEIAHTYMPFYMGTNETRYGFMDEGWATTFEYLIGQSDLGNEVAASFFKQFRVSDWIGDASSEQDIPIITPGDALTGQGFGNNEYGKAALGYLAMKELLGDELFKKCLQTYMQRWNGKHPIPWDFFNTYSNVSGKNLNWFWGNWFFSSYYIDLSVRDVVKVKSQYVVTLDNIGGMASPATIVLTYADGTEERFHQTPAIWEPNQKQAKVTLPAKKALKSLRLDGGIWMDADESNNVWMKK